MRCRRRWHFSGLLAIGLLFSQGSAVAGQVAVAVAANFTDTTRTLADRFEAATGHQVIASFGSTGKLYAQIRHGAPFDVFMAADMRRPALLESDGMGVAETRFTYARGKLVLWSPRHAAFTSPITYLEEQSFSRLAIANPKTAPYGLAARQVLEHLELWTGLQPKLVRGDSIAQAFQFIASGNTEAGLVALAQVKAWPEQDGTLWAIPQTYYEPIDQQAILLRRGADSAAAREWLAFLQSPEARDIIQGYGYDTAD